MLLPDDIALTNTHNFVSHHLPKAPARVLEIGAGDGALAERLQQRGYEVTALDSDSRAVAAIAARGVNAVQATWPDYHSAPFQAILFTRSLHQMHPLDAAIHRSRQLLTYGGALLVEDFAHAHARPQDIQWWCRNAGEWLKHYAASTEAGIASEFRMDSTAARLLTARDPIEVWREQHDRPRHSADDMDAALRLHFNQVRMEGAPYFFRYLIAALPANTRYTALVQHAYDQEMVAMSSGRLGPLGRRWICR